MDTEKDINSELKQLFGTFSNGLQKFRVSWSDSQTEIRKREYNEFSKGGLFVRTVRETAECPKYPLIKSKWILEKLVPPHPCYTDEIVSARASGSYECIYVFQDANKIYLPLNLTVAIIVVKAILEPNSIGKRTETGEFAQLVAEDKEKKAIDEAVGKIWEESMKKNRKYIDGTNANKYTDGLKIFVP